MTIQNENDVLINIQQLIDKSRCSIDGFFTDSKTAAINILKYLETENIIKKEGAVKLTYEEASKAA